MLVAVKCKYCGILIDGDKDALDVGYTLQAVCPECVLKKFEKKARTHLKKHGAAGHKWRILDINHFIQTAQEIRENYFTNKPTSTQSVGSTKLNKR